jgi:TolB-like protein/DNA-binding winged helix-turn-helix (wHTH) protein/tetratricopeptide (TPR) repeat protein
LDAEQRFLVTDRFYVDRRGEALVVDGAAVPLHHRTYQVLLALMSKPKALVTKRELFENVWGTLDVSDAVLTTAIKELRQALGDDARSPWAIATVHARGYRLLLRVRPSDKPDDGPDRSTARRPGRRFSRIAWIAALASVVLVSVVALYPERRSASGRPAETGQDSIAVLPFDDLSQEGDYAWFGNGLAEEIMNSLAQSRDLRVAARTSSFRYGGGGGTADIREIANALSVTHVMEGSVRRGADELRVTAQLIRAEDGFHVWSKTYDIPVDTGNALSLQREIAEDVLATVHASVLSRALNGNPPQLELGVYERYLRGRELVILRNPDSVLEGIQELNSVVRLAPGFAAGHAWLADAYLFSTQFSGTPLLESATAAELHVQKAMELEPDGADTLTAAALLELYRRDFDAALEFADRAVAANPNYVPALRRRGVILLTRGRVEEAHRDFLAVRARDPISATSLAHVSFTYSILNEVEHALEAAREGVRWNPEDAVAHGNLGRILGEVGEYTAAMRHLEKSVEINPATGLYTRALATLYWRVGLDDRLDDSIEAMVWPGLAAAAFSTGDRERGLQLAQTYEMDSTGTLAGIDFYHWYGDMELAYAPAMRLAARDRLVDSGLRIGYRHGAIPAMLALEANGDPQGAAIRADLEALFDDRRPGDLHFAEAIYGAASWCAVNGDFEGALAWLQSARDKGLVFRELRLDPIWDPIRDSAGFRGIVTAMDERAAAIRRRE